MALIKSISGIRGTIGGEVGENLTPIDLARFTASFASYISSEKKGEGPTKIVVGRDARISGAMCKSIVCGVLQGCGVDVVDIDLATTPTVEVAVTELGADGGIILTASHNPKQWNALKLLGSNGEFLNAVQGKKVLDMASAEEFSFAEVDFLGGVEQLDFNARHIEMVLALPLVDVEAVKARGFKVVVDAVNSVGGIVIPELLRQMGCEVVELNCVADGQFAHNPEPLKEHLTEISAKVKECGADLGVVVDPDVDRLAFISEDGEMFGEEYTLVAVADYILSKLGGGATVSNLSSSRALRDLTRGYGSEYSAAAVGEVNVVAKMKEVGAVIGGEGNGGIIYPELHYGRDALVGVALFLTYFTEKGCTMSELRKTYPQYFMSKNKAQLTPDIDVDALLETLADKYKEYDVTTIDGVKVDMPEGWVHLRKSNTEPIVRIYSEAHTQSEADELAQLFVNEILKK
ncbi:MAG: phosphoglucosamine mutase [Rikenellaceae bacterium]